MATYLTSREAIELAADPLDVGEATCLLCPRPSVEPVCAACEPMILTLPLSGLYVLPRAVAE